eukprot:5976914-Prymnesium_polylepis.1
MGYWCIHSGTVRVLMRKAENSNCGQIYRPITFTGAPRRTDEAHFCPDKLVRGPAPQTSLRMPKHWGEPVVRPGIRRAWHKQVAAATSVHSQDGAGHSL